MLPITKSRSSFTERDNKLRLRQSVTTFVAEAIILPHQTIWSWYTGRWWAGCYIWYTVPNLTARSSTASVPITVLLYNSPLLCGFNVPFKWLMTLLWFERRAVYRRAAVSRLLGDRECLHQVEWTLRTQNQVARGWKRRTQPVRNVHCPTWQGQSLCNFVFLA